jgi:hypothetical protein
VDGIPTNDPPMPAEALPHRFRTYDIKNLSQSWDCTGKSAIDHKPWTAPGHSPIANPCGIASGVKAGLPGPGGKPGGDGHGKPAPVPKGSTQGMNGTDLKPLDNISTTWEAGSVQEDPHQADGQGENTRLSDPSDRCQHLHEPQGVLLEAQSSPCVQLRFGLPLWQLLQAILDRSRG